MNQPEQQHVIERIHASGRQLMLSVTGGGSGAISALLEVPGASSSVLGAVVPYAQSALDSFLGGPVDQPCSERTARAMAMASFGLARTFSTADPHTLRGVGATASLASTRPKRGPHRVHVAWQSAETTVAISCELEKGRRIRAEEEAIASQLILDAVADACGVYGASLTEQTVRQAIHRREQRASAEWTELLLGERTATFFPDSSASEQPPPVLFPGAFNPLHAGHQQMAEIAASLCGAPVTFELSTTNVDKPPLDFIELADRLSPLAPHRVLISRAPTFAEKARLAPGCVFVVGSDTVERIGDLRYYHGDPTQRDAAIATIAAEGCRFLVFGRQQGDRFCKLADLKLPAALHALCDEVPESTFRADVSSTQLRTN